MKYKTLVKNHRSDYWEFYGFVNGYGWCTSTTPIQIMDQSATWTDVLNAFPDENFDDIDLVTFEVNITDVDDKFVLNNCDNCLEMTNHIDTICQKCKK